MEGRDPLAVVSRRSSAMRAERFVLLLLGEGSKNIIVLEPVSQTPLCFCLWCPQ